jgi:hypothetical protein
MRYHWLIGGKTEFSKRERKFTRTSKYAPSRVDRIRRKHGRQSNSKKGFRF